jgi:hypothetical protein
MPISKIRLSPSGPFVGVPPLEVGSDDTLGTGSPGMIWRQLGGSVGIELQSVTMIEILSSAAADGFQVPPGYHYELEGSIRQVTNAAPGTTRLGFEYSLDNVTWNTIPHHLGGTAPLTTNVPFDPPVSTNATLVVHCIDFDASGLVPVAPYTGILVRLAGMSSAAGAGNLAQQAWMRVTQYAHTT